MVNLDLFRLSSVVVRESERNTNNEKKDKEIEEQMP